MEFLAKKDGTLNQKLKNMPVKKAFRRTYSVALLLSFLLAIMILIATRPIQNMLADSRYYGFCTFAIVLLMVLAPATLMLGIFYWFYRIKFQDAISELMKGTQKIADNKLDFSIAYQSDDEMGQLCASFETMRQELVSSKKQVWRAVEERKRLNAAFAHDLRTPLTVLKGYTGFLEEYIPSRNATAEKLLETNCLMAASIDRVEQYVYMMSHIQKLENTPLSLTLTAQDALRGMLTESLIPIAQKAGKILEINITNPIADFTADLSLLQRVLENLIQNACRYAHSTIVLTASRQGDFLQCIVQDDGIGFQESYLKHTFRPFYQGGDSNGFGLGLYICKVLCENHGGSLLLEQAKPTGAKVISTFYLKC